MHSRWRDESGAALDEGCAGVDLARPACPILVVAGDHDDTVLSEASRAMASQLEADMVTIRGASHLGLLLGRHAPGAAAAALAWLGTLNPPANTR